jgi:hypothetical protein
MTILQVFHISPLIRLTLTLLYVALTIPLPYLAQVTAAPVSPIALSLALVIGIAVTYPPRVKWIFQGVFQRGWFLAWEEVESLKPRWTGQGGIVYYFVSRSQAAYLLPMRIAGFARLLNWVEAKTHIDTKDIKPLAQPWMYFILLGCTLLLLGLDLWVVINAGS